jgi:hypothetical protein
MTPVFIVRYAVLGKNTPSALSGEPATMAFHRICMELWRAAPLEGSAGVCGNNPGSVVVATVVGGGDWVVSVGGIDPDGSVPPVGPSAPREVGGAVATDGCDRGEAVPHPTSPPESPTVSTDTKVITVGRHRPSIGRDRILKTCIPTVRAGGLERLL